MSKGSTSKDDKNSDGELSQSDVERLLNDGSADSRINVLEKIADKYNGGSFQEKEFIFAEQIFRLMMKDAEVKVREALADELKESKEIPRDIVLHMAKDVEQVAMPVLEASDVLSDADLVQIVESTKEISKLLKISERNAVSSRVSEALVDSQNEKVVETLLKNDGADIGENTYQQILEDFSDRENITGAMSERNQIPANVVEKLVNYVSESVAGELKKKYKVAEDTDLGQQARESVTLEFLNFNQSDEEVDRNVIHMINAGRLSPSMILSALCRGHLSFFEISLARLAGIPRSNARKLIHDKGPLGFNALYLKTQLPDSMFDAVRLVTQSVRALDEEGAQPGNPQYSNDLVSRVLEGAKDREIDNLPYVIALIRQSANG